MLTNINDVRPIKIGNEEIEIENFYKYLGHEMKLDLENQTSEIRRKIGLSWAPFGKFEKQDEQQSEKKSVRYVHTARSDVWSRNYNDNEGISQ